MRLDCGACLGAGPLGGHVPGRAQGQTTPTQASCASALRVAPPLLESVPGATGTCGALWVTASLWGPAVWASRRHDDWVLAPEVLWSLVGVYRRDSLTSELGVRYVGHAGGGLWGDEVSHTAPLPWRYFWSLPTVPSLDPWILSSQVSSPQVFPSSCLVRLTAQVGSGNLARLRRGFLFFFFFKSMQIKLKNLIQNEKMFKKTRNALYVNSLPTCIVSRCLHT